MQNVRELDYCSMITLELWSTISGGKTEYSIRLSVSEGAHADFPLDSSVDSVSFDQMDSVLFLETSY